MPKFTIGARLSLILFAVLLSTAFTSGQTPASSQTTKITITGVVVDSVTLKGVQFATVAILDSTNRSIVAIASDANGKFSLELKEKGEFRVYVGSLGYSETVVPLNVDWAEQKADIGTFALTAGVQVKEVVVAAQAPLITADAEKMVYNVEADPDSQTSTVLEIMRKVPQLSVDGEDNVLLNGQGNYKVLVDGKTSNMYSRNFKEVIRSLPANSIKDIEVITNPSMRYESEGVGGIINIVTNKKTRVQGYNGTVNLGGGSYNSYNGGIYFNMQQGKFNMSLNYNLSSYGSPPSGSSGYGTYTNTDTDVETYEKSGSRSDSRRSLSNMLSLGASYDIDSLNLITLELWGYTGSSKGNSNSYTMRSGDRDDWSLSALSLSSENKSSNKFSYGSISGSLDYQRMFKKPDRSLTVSYKLDSSPEKSSSGSDQYYTAGPLSTYFQRSENKANGTEHTLQVDFYNPITKKHVIEAGVKHIIRINTSNTTSERRDALTDPWVEYPNNMNDMDYTQNIFGAYGGYSFRQTKFTAKAGFRLEGTWNDGIAKTISGNVDIHNKMFNVIPYANFAYMLKPTQTFTFAYTQRLQRPAIYYLNPYVNNDNPLYIYYGNPRLKPSVMNSFSLGYRMFGTKHNFSINLNAMISNNYITSVTDSHEETVNSEEVTVTESTYDNIGRYRNYSATASYGYRLTTKFSVNASFMGSYMKYQSNTQSNDGFTYSANVGSMVSLWKGASFNVNAMYTSGSINLNSSQNGYFYYMAGLSQNFLKNNKLTVRVSATNPFHYSRTFKNDIFTAATEQNPVMTHRHSEAMSVMRRFTVYVGYRFGKTNVQVKRVRRGISNDDRMSGEASGGGSSAQ